MQEGTVHLYNPKVGKDLRMESVCCASLHRTVLFDIALAEDRT